MLKLIKKSFIFINSTKIKILLNILKENVKNKNNQKHYIDSSHKSCQHVWLVSRKSWVRFPQEKTANPLLTQDLLNFGVNDVEVVNQIYFKCMNSTEEIQRKVWRSGSKFTNFLTRRKGLSEIFVDDTTVRQYFYLSRLKTIKKKLYSWHEKYSEPKHMDIIYLVYISYTHRSKCTPFFIH